MITTAFVHLWNNRVGAVAWDSTSGLGTFEYDPTFLDQKLDLAPLKMPISNERRIFSFLELRNSQTFKGLPGLLADLIPDKYGNAIINAWLAQNGRPANSLNPVELLCFIGTRGMGALEFEPAEPNLNHTSTSLELESLIQVAGDILSGRESFNTQLSAEESKALSDILKIGTSAGGARAKAVIAYNPVTSEIRSGQTNVPDGFSHWLLKFDGIIDQQLGKSSGYGRVEMAYYNMARASGINMMESRLLEENGRAHFMTRRFDRDTENGKIHIQSFCALSHYDFNDILSFSYEQLFETMRALRLPYADAEQLYRRMVFNVMARNCDDHTKNFSFLMDHKGIWKLSPAYDVCHAYRPDSIWVSQQSLSVNGKRHQITREDLLAVAKNMNIKKAKDLIDEVRQVVAQWNDFAKETQVDPVFRDAISKTLLLL